MRHAVARWLIGWMVLAALGSGMEQWGAWTSGKMYWASPVTQTIQRANLDGSQVETLRVALGEPHGIALDVAKGKMYWTGTSSSDPMVQRANLDGSAAETLIRHVGFPLGIALDVVHSKMYWTQSL